MSPGAASVPSVDGARLDSPTLRRAVLAVSVLHDVPVEATDAGVRVRRSWDDREGSTEVGWAELAAGVSGADPDSVAGRLRLRDWLRARAYVAAGPSLSDGRRVPLALPTAHVLHPGGSWAVQRVLGGVLEVGVGLRGDDGGRPAPLPASAVPPDAACVPWSALQGHLVRMAALAVERLERDGG